MTNRKIPKGKSTSGKDFKEKTRTGRSQSTGKSDTDKEEDSEEGSMSLVKEDRMPASIIPRIRRVGRIGHRWALGMNDSIENTAARGAIGSTEMERGAECEIRLGQKS